MGEYTQEKMTIEGNNVLKRELSGYRIINNQFVPITSEIEIEEIEQALSQPDKFKGARTHLETALEMLSDRTAPDYRNSIKESISAVESIAKTIADKPKATLADALNVVAQKISLHGAQKEAFMKLYGYTSDAGGIRHSMMAEPDIDFADAKYMLVSCSAFVNYLIEKLKDGEG